MSTCHGAWTVAVYRKTEIHRVRPLAGGANDLRAAIHRLFGHAERYGEAIRMENEIQH